MTGQGLLGNLRIYLILCLLGGKQKENRIAYAHLTIALFSKHISTRVLAVWCFSDGSQHNEKLSERN
jgi:hypothetical protein